MPNHVQNDEPSLFLPAHNDVLRLVALARSFNASQSPAWSPALHALALHSSLHGMVVRQVC